MSNVTWSYDEERELTRYLWENYAEFFSPQERHLAQVIAARQVAIVARRPIGRYCPAIIPARIIATRDQSNATARCLCGATASGVARDAPTPERYQD